MASALTHLEQGFALYDPQKYRSHAFRATQNPGAACLTYAALVLWLLGYPDRALQRSHQAVTMAQEPAHPLSLACALDYAAMLHQFRREGQAAQACAEAAVTLSAEQGFAGLLRTRHGPAGVGTGRAGTGGGGPGADRLRAGSVADDGSRSAAAVLSRPPG